MKKGSIYSLITGIIILLSGCAGGKFQVYDLNEEYATSLHYQPPAETEAEPEEEKKSGLIGVPALSFYGGDLKRGAIWWAGKGFSLGKGDVFNVSADSVGPDSTSFGATFPPIDLIAKEVALKVSVRAEGENGDMPNLYLQVADVEGYQANSKQLFYKIENTGEFKEYYFDMRDIYNQSFPKKHKVNGALINSLKFFVNPGQTPFTGKIYIKEIRVVPLPSVGK
jgi:hypothetical protein